MKVAIVDLLEGVRIGGVETWVKHVMQHWQGDVEYVKWRTPSKEAQQSILLGSKYRVLRGSFKKRVEQLQEYDFLLLSHLYNRLSKMPDAYEAVISSGVPWTVMVHGRHEGRKTGAEYTQQLFYRSNFIGKVCSTSVNFVTDLEDKVQDQIETIELPYLPYTRRGGDSVPAGEDWLSTCVLTANKGIVPMMLATAGTGRDLTFYGMVDSTRYGRHDLIALEKVGKALERQYVDSVFESLEPWEHQLPTGEYIQYRGSYEDVGDVMAQGRVHLNLTSARFCTDHLEYTTLEAMDFGLLPLVPSCQLPSKGIPPYVTMRVADYVQPSKFSLEAIQSQLRQSDMFTRVDIEYFASINRRVLEDLHDPVKYVARIQEELHV